MISCQHKHVLFATNLGAMTEHCNELGVFVDDKICEGCGFREGETPYVPDFEVPGKRHKEEISIIMGVCESCPLFNKDTRQCKKIQSPIPISTLAQNRMLKCPERKW